MKEVVRSAEREPVASVATASRRYVPGLPAALRTVSLTMPAFVVVQLMRAVLAARFLAALTTRRFGVIRRPLRTMRTGAGSLKFDGRLAGKALKAGTYRIEAVATDATGSRSALRTTSFRVIVR